MYLNFEILTRVYACDASNKRGFCIESVVGFICLPFNRFILGFRESDRTFAICVRKSSEQQGLQIDHNSFSCENAQKCAALLVT